MTKTYKYILPSETTVKRTFAHEDMQQDVYDLLLAGELLITLNYESARRYWTGKISLADLLAGEQNRPAEMVKL